MLEVGWDPKAPHWQQYKQYRLACLRVAWLMFKGDKRVEVKLKKKAAAIKNMGKKQVQESRGYKDWSRA